MITPSHLETRLPASRGVVCMQQALRRGAYSACSGSFLLTRAYFVCVFPSWKLHGWQCWTFESSVRSQGGGELG